MNELVRVVGKEARWQLTLNSVRQAMWKPEDWVCNKTIQRMRTNIFVGSISFRNFNSTTEGKRIRSTIPSAMCTEMGTEFLACCKSQYTTWLLCRKSSIPSINADESRTYLWGCVWIQDSSLVIATWQQERRRERETNVSATRTGDCTWVCMSSIRGWTVHSDF